ncbi:MAG TPA: SDR family NAD(P)-dependent oxidoreductase [Planctomycetota bacterium]|nr:SDR family NAD(P)-dependent oxidoreductase [Planctomycetota bacterium]
MKLLEGKVAIVTGAGGGLGRSHALALAAEGAKVVVNDPGVSRDGSGGTGAKMADAVVAEILKAGGLAVANYDSVADAGEKIVKAAVDAFGKVDILVNNAGILRDKTIHNMTDDMWDLVLAVHLRGTFGCTRAAARVMKEKGQGGRIINTTSVAGLKGNFGQSNYSAAKAGIYGFTMTASMELLKDGITVNAIAPIAKTRMTEEIDSVPAEYRPEEVSPLVVFFASDLAKDITGRIIGVHGRHLFEYRMENSEGKEKKDAWTPPEINTWIRTPETPKSVAAAPAGGGNKVAEIFKGLPGAFDPEKAAGWDSLIHFAITGSGDWTVEVKDKKVRVAPGKPDGATSVITTDTDTLVGMVEGRVKGDMAFMSGKLKATKVPDLGKFGKAFDFKKIKVDGAAAAPAAGGGGSVADIFTGLPAAFDPEKSAGWETLIHFAVAGAGDWTVEVKDKKVKVAEGKPAAPTSVISTDTDTLVGMVEGRVKGDMAFMSGKLKATKVPDLGKFGKAFDFKKIKVGVGAPAATPAASKGPVDLGSLLSRLQGQFLPDKAAGFNATLLFKVDGQAATLEIRDKAASVRPPVPLATCTITTDGATLSGIVDGSLDGQKAFSEGKIKLTHLPSWLKFRQMFKFAPEKGLHRSLIGRHYGGAAQLIRPEKLAAYDAAVGDEGSIVFPVTLVKDPFVKLFEDPDFNGELSRMVHGEQVFVFHRPLKAWDLITPRGRVLGIEDKSSGQVLNFGQRIYCEGELVVEMESRLFFRGDTKGEKSPPPPPVAKPAATSTSTVAVGAELPRRYAEASGDMNPIHVDKTFAQSAGFKDVILHGLGTLALVARTFPQRPGRLQVRFAKPVYPGDSLTTSFWKKDDKVEFETLNASGEAVLTQGLLEL